MADQNPVQSKPTPEEIARINLRRWLDEKRLRDAGSTAKEGMIGHAAGR